MVARFLFFVILFALIFAFIIKWVWVKLKRVYDKEEESFEKTYRKTELKRIKCKSMETHNLKDKRANTKCSWCGKTVKEIKEEEKEKQLVYG